MITEVRRTSLPEGRMAVIDRCFNGLTHRFEYEVCVFNNGIIEDRPAVCRTEWEAEVEFDHVVKTYRDSYARKEAARGRT